MASPALADKAKTDADKLQPPGESFPDEASAAGEPNEGKLNTAVRDRLSALVSGGALPKAGFLQDSLSPSYIKRAVTELRPKVKDPADIEKLDALEFFADPPEILSADRGHLDQSDMDRYVRDRPHLSRYVAAAVPFVPTSAEIAAYYKALGSKAVPAGTTLEQFASAQRAAAAADTVLPNTAGYAEDVAGGVDDAALVGDESAQVADDAAKAAPEPTAGPRKAPSRDVTPGRPGPPMDPDRLWREAAKRAEEFGEPVPRRVPWGATPQQLGEWESYIVRYAGGDPNASQIPDLADVPRQPSAGAKRVSVDPKLQSPPTKLRAPDATPFGDGADPIDNMAPKPSVTKPGRLPPGAMKAVGKGALTGAGIAAATVGGVYLADYLSGDRDAASVLADLAQKYAKPQTPEERIARKYTDEQGNYFLPKITPGAPEPKMIEFTAKDQPPDELAWTLSGLSLGTPHEFGPTSTPGYRPEAKPASPEAKAVGRATQYQTALAQAGSDTPPAWLPSDIKSAWPSLDKLQRQQQLYEWTYKRDPKTRAFL